MKVKRSMKGMKDEMKMKGSTFVGAEEVKCMSVGYRGVLSQC